MNHDANTESMTPEQYQEVRRIFAAAVQLPNSKRESFVRQESSDAVVQEEVCFLLEHHKNSSAMDDTERKTIQARSIKETHTVRRPSTDTPRELVQPFHTADLVKRSNPGSPGAKSVDKMAFGAHDDLTSRFANSTRQLLRGRLLIACALIAAMLLTATLVGVITDSTILHTLVIRTVTAMVLGSVASLLYRNPEISLENLRRCEIIVMAAPLVELMLLLWARTRLLESQEPLEVPVLHTIVCWAVATYIALYGILIPSHWRRTAAVCFAIATIPYGVIFLLRIRSDTVIFSSAADAGNIMLLLMMVGIATAGSHVVHRVRHEAIAARMYGQYQIVEEIGRGGMGAVYLAKHRLLKRPAAIKLIHLESARQPTAIQSFEQEVQISATLTHWNTVQVFDYGVTDQGDFYYVMEHLNGESLYQRLVRKGTLSVDETLTIISQVCDGLYEAHSKSFVHRDLKPANLFLAEIGGLKDVVKILDFGLAVSQASLSEQASQRICGTPSYMSPESIRAEKVDCRSDIYALGCIIFECLAGRPPFVSATATKTMSLQLNQAPDFALLQEVDGRVVAIAKKCLNKDPSQRYKSVAELKQAVEEVGLNST